MKGVPVQQLTHVAVQVVNDFLDAEKIAFDMKDLIIVQESRKRQMVTGNQHHQREREPYAPSVSQKGNQREYGVGAQRCFDIPGYVDSGPLEHIPRAGD